MADTKQKSYFQIFSPMFPKEGPKTVPLIFKFADGVSQDYQFDTDTLNDIEYIQSVWVDASDCASPVKITCNISLHTITVQPGEQGIWPVIAPNPFKFNIACADAEGVVKTQFMNVPMALARYGLSAAGSGNATAANQVLQINLATIANTILNDILTGIGLIVTGIGNLFGILQGANWVDHSGNTSAGVSAAMIAANAARKRIIIQNPSANTESFWIKFGSAADAGVTSVEVPPGGGYATIGGTQESPQVVNVYSVNAIPFIAWEM